MDLIGVSNLGLGLTSPVFLPTDEAYAIECADLLRHDPSAAPFQSLLLPPPPKKRQESSEGWTETNPGRAPQMTHYRFFFF